MIEKIMKNRTFILAGVFLLAALLSIAIPGRVLSKPESYAGSVQELNDAKLGVEKLAASAAAAYLNAIRRRSPSLSPSDASTVSLQMILDERSKEFFGEGLRFFDLIRLNQRIEFNDDFQNVPISTRSKVIDRTFGKIVLPIPQDEINANPAIADEQNPAYV